MLQATKRALASILLSIASQYGLDLKLTRDYPDSAVQTAYRRVALKAHPDKGGDEEIAKELFAAKAAWDDARKSSSKKARPMHRRNHSRPPRREKKAPAAPQAAEHNRRPRFLETSRPDSTPRRLFEVASLWQTEPKILSKHHLSGGEVALADSAEDPLEASPLCSKVALEASPLSAARPLWQTPSRICLASKASLAPESHFACSWG